MAKGLNKEYTVNLAFTADTDSAKQNIQSLSQELQNLVTSTSLKTKNFGIDKDLQSATASAAQLKVQLEAAVNTDTGKLDLSKFSDSLKKSGMTLEKYQNQLYQLGPEGQKAFSDLSKAITLAEVPLKRTSSLMSELWTTMKNTARWQLTSSAMHSFIGAIQHAYYYAQDLNESLNNIRIVSSASVEQMDKFAEKANKAAKSLSSTTLDYTNAALIYYQQGLTDKEVADRTEVTLKMANAARESATTISQQLTSVWNNFYDGSESLEHYADAMVRLGADTASSSSEISEGLQKFSSVASTIGLSFDNAAAALATITATTRESADIVGTALKTLFSRIQGLNLGKTLDDGTDLNKYSTALHKVGIEIKDTDGQLKDMDVILDEMGTKWNTWSRDTQMSLAQTVAGVRQYTQLMTLMNNYDFYKENVERAKNSEGSLQEQADIYAESWDAAKDRVQASAEAIYKSLINDQFFIEFNNGISTLLDGVNGFIKGMGGVKGLLLSLGSIVTRVFSKQIAESFSNLIFNIKGLTSTGRSKLEDMKKEANKLTIEGYMDTGGTSGEYTSQAYSLVAQNQLDYLRNVDNMTTEEQKVNQILMDRNRLLADSVAKRGEELENLETQISKEKISLEIAAQRKAQETKSTDFDGNGFKRQLNVYQKKSKTYSIFSGLEEQTFNQQGLEKGSEESKKLAQKIKNSIINSANIKVDDKNNVTDTQIEAQKKLQETFALSERQAKQLWQELSQPIENISIEDLNNTIEKIINSADKSKQKIEGSLIASLIKSGFTAEEAKQKIQPYIDAIEQYGIKSEQAKAEAEKLGQVVQNHGNLMDQARIKTIGYGEAINRAASAIMAMYQIYNQIVGIIKVFNDENSTTGQKIGAIVGGIVMLIPAIQSIIPALSTAKIAATKFGQEMAVQGAIAQMSMWQLTLIITAVTIAIVALVALIDEANRKSPEGQFKKAAENAEKLSDAMEEAKSQAESLHNAFDKYDEIEEKLNNCTEGTLEWKEALQEANDAVLDILAQYPELQKMDGLWYRNSAGLLQFNKEKEATVLEQADTQANVAQAASLMGAVETSQAKVNWRESQLANSSTVNGVGDSRKIQNSDIYDEYVNIGKLLTDNISDLTDLTESEYREKVSELIDKAVSDQSKQSANWNSQMASLIETCVEYQGQVDSLADETKAAANQMHNATMIIAQNKLGDDYDAAAVSMASNLYDDVYEKIKNEIITADAESNSKGDNQTITSKDIWERFNEANGTNLKAADNQIQGTDSNRKYAYINEKGNVDTYSIDYIADTIAAYEAMKELTGSADEASEALSNIDKVAGQEIGQAIKEYITSGNFDSLSQDELDTMQNDINTTYNGNTGDYLKTLFNTDDEQQIANFLGAENFDEAVASFNEGLTSVQTALNSAGDNLTETVKGTYDSLDTSDLDAQAKKNLGDVLTKAFINAGSEGLSAVKEVFSGIENGSEEFAGALDGIDWQTATISTVTEALNKAGVTGNWTAEQLQALIKALHETGKASLESATQNYAAIHKITDGLSQGDTISAEDYTTLGTEYQKYFMLMADGTYKLTHDAEEFQKIVKENTLKPFQDVREKSKEDQTQLENIKQGEILTSGQTGTVSRQNLQREFNILQAVGETDDANLAEWQEQLKNVGDSANGDWVNDMAEAYDQWMESVGGTEGAIKSLDAKIIDCQNTTLGAEIAIASTYDNIKDLTQAFNNGEFELQAFNTALVQLDATSDLNGLDADELKDYADYLQEAAKSATEAAEGMADFNDNMSDKEAKIVAKGIMKMNDAIDDLADNFSDWQDVLKKSSKDSEEYSKALTNTQKAIGQLLDISEDYVSEDFITKHLDEIKKAATGNADAIDDLRAALAQDIIAKIVLKNGIDESAIADINKDIASLQEWLNNNDLKIGASIDMNQLSGDEENFLATCQNIIDKAGMTADQANAFFDSMGFETTFMTESKPVEKTGHSTITSSRPIGSQTYTTVGPDGEMSQIEVPSFETFTTAGQEYKYTDYVDAIAMNTDSDGNPTTPKIESITRKATGSSNNYSSSNSGGKGPGKSSGGGGSKSKASKKDLTKKSDVVDRYKEIDDSIHDLTRALDKGNKAADRMWGKSRISAMKANNKMLQDEIGLLNKKAEEAKKYLALDKQELLLAAKKAGVNFQFDEDGDISNYTQEMTRLYDELHAAEEHINSLKTKEAQDEYEESVLKAIEDKIAELKSALSQYEETKSLIEDLEDEAEDKFYEWQDNNFEILNHELEVKITLDDNELKKLDYFFNKLSDNIYKAAEALGYLQGQIDPTFGKMKSYEDYYNSLESSYANGEISQAAYVEGLQDAYDSIIDNLEAVQDLDKQMLEYYGNTLDLAEEELSKYTDQMEHLTSVLDHYRSILSLLGRDTDYTRVLTVLEGNAQTKRNKFDTSKAWYESLKAERDAAAAALAQASDDAERELLQKNYDAIVAKFNEAEEQMLSDAEAYGEAIKEVLTTKMEQAAENMNKAMTDGMGWDALNDSLDRLSKYQDEYLTKTNQIYEMNKLLNDVNKASNKTNNQAAKDKYYQFSKEIEQLREKDKLSQLELDIAQAKYKVLQAQITLDEAQNAMGKVRLQRDNEGNFGYVYTADQDKIDDAQQALADAENDLYNIRLDATNKYGQQKLQYEQELAEKLKEIDEKANEDALYREGNYQADRQRIIDEYTQLIQASSDLYRIAQEEDSRVVQDAWVNAYDEIIDSGDQWKTAIIDYTGQINNAFQEWQAETDRLTDLVGKDLVDTKNKVNDVTNASDQLKDEVINKVVPALTQELQAVRNATEAYARQRQEIMNLISYYEQLISKIQQAIAAQASMDAGSNSPSSDYDDYDPSVDYSALMGTVPVGSELYNKYKAYRDRKMSEGNYGNMASTARINKFYEMGYKLGEGKFAEYTNFTQIPDWLWEETVGKTFRTGGYTGSWGESGKLAVLHEKELVLNKEDTQNMLSSIKMVREIASEIDLRSRYTTMPINPIYSTFGTGNDILEQQVHIDASFPNVTDRNEIQEAFNTLINVASQYANRK